MAKLDGGPAFPFVSNLEEYNGMSLRDYYAGQALTGLVLACCIANSPLVGPGTAAKGAYEFADALLAERAKDSFE